jgi:hypothetical protein
VDRDEMLRVLRAFEQEGLEYVLIGAAAMGFHGLVRATEDLDILIRATPENVERLKRAFRAAYDDDPSVQEISSTDLLGDYPAAAIRRAATVLRRDDAPRGSHEVRDGGRRDDGG